MGIKSKRSKQEHGDMKCTCGHVLIHKEHLIDLDNRVKSGKMAFKDATAEMDKTWKANGEKYHDGTLRDL